MWCKIVEHAPLPKDKRFQDLHDEHQFKIYELHSLRATTQKAQHAARCANSAQILQKELFAKHKKVANKFKIVTRKDRNLISPISS